MSTIFISSSNKVVINELVMNKYISKATVTITEYIN